MDFHTFIQQRIDKLPVSTPPPDTKSSGPRELPVPVPSSAQTRSAHADVQGHEAAKSVQDRQAQDLRKTLEYLKDNTGQAEHDFIMLQLLIGEKATTPAELEPKLRALLANTTGDHAALLEFVGAELFKNGYSKAVIQKRLTDRAPHATAPGVASGLAERRARLLAGMGADQPADKPDPEPPRPFIVETKNTPVQPTQTDRKHSPGPAVQPADECSELSAALFERPSTIDAAPNQPSAVIWHFSQPSSSAPHVMPPDRASDLADEELELSDEPDGGPSVPPLPDSKASLGSVRPAAVADPELEAWVQSDPATAASHFATRIAANPTDRAKIARPVWERVLRSDIAEGWRSDFLSKLVEAMRQGDPSARRSTKGALHGALNYASGTLIAKAGRGRDEIEKQRLARQAIAIEKALDKLADRSSAA